jgi:hypothetical protein
MRNLKMLKTKKILVLLLTIFSSTAFADLELVQSDDSSKIYINTFASKDLGKGVVRVFVLESYKEISSAQMFGLSVETRMDLNCDAQLVRELDSTWYSKQMGKGKVTEKFPAETVQWIPFFSTTEPAICEFLQHKKPNLYGL